MRFRALLLLPLFLACTQKQIKVESLLGYLPQKPSAILRINHLPNLKTELNNGLFIQALEDNELIATIETKLSLLQELDSDSELVIGFYEIGKNDIEFVLAATDLGSNAGITINESQQFDYEGETVSKYSKNENDYFLWKINGNYLISSSQLLIENLIRSDFPSKVPETLQRIYNSSEDTKSASIFINLSSDNALISPIAGTSNENSLLKFANWMALDLSTEKNNLHLNGISVAKDSVPHFLNLFKRTIPSVESTASIFPKNSDGLVSYRFGDFNVFAQNQRKYLDLLKEPDTLLNTIEEVGIAAIGNNKLVALKSFGPSNLTNFLTEGSTKSTDYQGSEIRQLIDPDFLVPHLTPVLKEFKANFWVLLENTFVFSNNEDALKNLIANKNSGTTFDTNPAYLESRELLPNESSLFFVSNKGEILSFLNGIASAEFLEQFDSEKLGDFAFAGQLVADGNLFHTQLLINKVGSKQSKQSVAPILTVQLENDLATHPQFVKNHRNGQYEMVVQDKDRFLYLIDAQGKILWKKQLDGTVRGKIHQVDLYKNGRLQMAFCTNNQFIVLDRNGEITKGIEKTYEGGNLNGLAVFDYENSRNYRMVVTQGKKVFMYNNEGKSVDGFTYNEAKSSVLYAPKHFRINKRDYLVFQLENGDLKILHRNGKERVKVNRTIDFSDNEVYLYKNKFSVTDKKGVLHQVDTRGKLSATDFNLSETHGMYATSKTLALMDENILSIKGKKVELELGVYTKPIIFYIYDKIYVAVTDLQNQKIYLFDSQAKPIPNFPVYGTSLIDLTDVDGDRKLELVAKDQENSIILYGIN